MTTQDDRPVDDLAYRYVVDREREYEAHAELWQYLRRLREQIAADPANVPACLAGPQHPSRRP